MNVVGIDGSGRGGGNTAVLVNAVLQGAAESGARTRLISLAGLDLAGCDGCQACKQSHRCVIEDDMSKFYDIAPETDVLVLGTPIYFDQVTAQMKAFLDRLYCYLGPALENHYPNPDARAVFAITYGAGGDSTYDGIVDWLKGRLKGYYKIETAASFAIPTCGHEPLIGADHPVVQAAVTFGRGLA